MSYTSHVNIKGIHGIVVFAVSIVASLAAPAEPEYCMTGSEVCRPWQHSRLIGLIVQTSLQWISCYCVFVDVDQIS